LEKLNSGNSKIRRIGRVIDNIIAYRSDLNSFENSSSNEGIKQSFEKLLEKFEEVNNLDKRFIPCEQYEELYSKFLYNHILNAYKGNNCNELVRYFDKLKEVNIQLFNSFEIQKIYNECQKSPEIVKDSVNCQFKELELKAKFNEAENEYLKCSLEASRAKIIEAKKDYDNFPKQCKASVSINKLDSLQELIIKSIEQRELLKAITNDFEDDKCLKAYEKSLKVDSLAMCPKDYKNYEIELKKIKCCVFRVLVDSSSRANNLKFYTDCKLLANRAIAFVCNSTDSLMATRLYLKCDCMSRNPEKCDIIERCDSLKIYSKSIYVGAGLNNISKNFIGKQTSFLIGYRNYNLKPMKHFSIGHFEELSINAPDISNYQEISAGGLVNYIFNKRICNNNPIVIGTFAIAPSYPFNFNNTLISSNYFTNISTYQRFQLKLEPQITFRFKSGLLSIGYQKTVFENKVKLNTESIRFRIGLVF
jgi:hypothetical protein